MCGICGLYHADGQLADAELLARMIATLHHRGPDNVGVWADGPVGLANARLAVIDLSPDAAQPMGNEDGSIWIVFNGEIYNYQTLRRQAAARGHQLFSHSDTEVLLCLYEDYGPACLGHLRGMFAFAIWDSRQRRLFLARDRVGKKPLFYYCDPERFVFGSEIKALLAHPLLPRRLKVDAVPAYLVYGYVPAPDTMFADIQELPPGHWLTLEDGQISVERYWDVPWTEPSPPLSNPEAAYIEELLAHLREAVRIRLVSDVPLGAFLSGGLDSSLIVALMAQLMDEPVKTFAIGFAGEPSFDERPHARRVAEYLGTDHHEFVVRPDAIELLPKLVRHYDQPFADSSAIPTYLVSQLTREQVTVALTGDGGDEVFAGYERFAAARLAELYRRVPAPLRQVLAGVLHRLPESTSYRGPVRRMRRFVDSAALPLLDRYLGWVGLFDPDLVAELMPDWAAAASDVRRHLGQPLEAVQSNDITDQLLYLNATTYLPGDLLVKTDRASMAHGLEARCPFLDQELIAWAATVPAHLKLRRMTTKYLLKRAAEGLLPSEIVYRPKHGFGVPVGRWFRTDLKEFVRDVLLSQTARQRGYFDATLVERMIEDHHIGQRDWGHQLWALLTFEMWHRLYLDSHSV
jgi:asparagine synthase (glutamine-hydrolysing)